MLLTDKEYPGSIKHSLYDKDFGYSNQTLGLTLCIGLRFMHSVVCNDIIAWVTAR